MTRATRSPLRERLAELERRLAAQGAAAEARGAVYTPRPVAAAMARALLPLDARPRRVLDPACGTGQLLLAAFERLSQDERDPVRRLAVLDALHGAELDPTALEVAKLALLLRAGGEDPPAGPLARARAGLDARLRLGDALVGPAAPLEVRSAAAGPALAWEGERFDAILANPPYTSFYARAARKPPPELERYLAARFRDQVGGRRNTYLFFVALCLELLDPRGRLCLLVPDTLAINASYGRTRAALCGRGVERLCRIEGPVFPGRSVGSLVLTVAGTIQGAAELETYPDARAFAQGAPSQRERAPRALLARPPGRTWLFGGVEAMSRVARIRAGREPLERFARPRDGINHGSKEVARRLFDPPGPPRATWGPLLEGKDVHPYVVSPPTRVVDYDPALLSREDKRRGASLRRPEVFRGPKLVNRQTASTLIFALDEEGHYARNSVHCTRALPGLGRERELLVYLLGLLNSRLLRYVYEHESQETRRVHPQVHIARTRSLPIAGASDPVARSAVCGHVEALIEMHAARRGDPSSIREGRLRARQSVLDALVLDIYGVGGDDRAAIQAWEERE